jgi:hypothetical protein
MPDGTFLHLLLAAGLALKLFIEREDGALRAVVDVSCASSSGAELGAGLWETVLEERGGTASSAAVARLWSLVEVSSATTAGMCVLLHGWVRLGELVWHFECRVVV